MNESQPTPSLAEQSAVASPPESPESGIKHPQLIFGALLDEYKVLKDEQSSRIGFRDNLLYVTLSAMGAIFAFVAANPDYKDALLVVPWASVILGWTYVVNDHHISQLGLYVRSDLRAQLQKLLGMPTPIALFGWEEFHRADQTRVRRKQFQLLVDLLTFIFSGVAAIGVFVFGSSIVNAFESTIIVIESVMLLILAGAIGYYSDWGRSRN